VVVYGLLCLLKKSLFWQGIFETAALLKHWGQVTVIC